VNAGRLGVEVGDVQAVVLSHGHFAPTVAALTGLAPELIVPGHCTGWRAQHPRRVPPDAWVQTSVGTTSTPSGSQSDDA
jgi:metal-dependent hydrolase (beta-lactamase superfamily II)